MNAISAVIGFINLILGSQLNWVFVGGAGFFIGRFLGERYHLVNKELDLILLSLVLSGIVIMLSIYFQRLMASIAGFFIGIFIINTLPDEFGWNITWISWQILVLAGIFSALAVFFWKTWSTILLSTIGGAAAIIHNIHFEGIGDLGMFTVLFVVGFTAQFLQWHYGKPDQE